MKLLKIFESVALALMAMAFVGTGSAMAESTALCEADENPCAGNQITHVHEATEAGNPAILKTNILTIKCDALYLGDSVEGLGNPLEIEGKITVTNCSSGCAATEISVGVLAKVLKLGHDLADVEVELEGNVKCGSLINCNYDASGVLGHTLGALLASVENGQTRFEEQELHKVSGLLCPKTAVLSALTSPLSAYYVTA